MSNPGNTETLAPRFRWPARVFRRMARALQRFTEIMEMAAQAARDLSGGIKTEGKNEGTGGPKEPEVGLDLR